MAIKRQDFYEGAALLSLVRTGQVTGIHYSAPFFLLNDRIFVLLKYTTKGRTPWGFTFSADEQSLLKARSKKTEIAIALVCGADGVAAFDYASYANIALCRKKSVHISCYRKHGEYYEISGPDGTLDRKVPPSSWHNILNTL